MSEVALRKPTVTESFCGQQSRPLSVTTKGSPLKTLLVVGGTAVTWQDLGILRIFHFMKRP